MQAITDVLLGFFTWINETITGNFALTIILFTVLFRLVCLPLDFYSRKGQRDFAIKTRALQPEIDAITKAYQNDPQKQQQNIMELRRKNGLGMMPKGCLSQLLVYPLLIAFFAVFRNMAALQIKELSNFVTQYGVNSPQVSQPHSSCFCISSSSMLAFASEVTIKMSFCAAAIGARIVLSAVIPS